MALSSAAFRRLAKELTTLLQLPPEGIRICMSEDDVLDFTGWVEGPIGTPYEKGYFAIKVMPTHDFPAAPPKCWFQTKVFHPNVNGSTGEICVSTLKKDWQPHFGVAHILQTVKCLLIAPNAESALNEEAGKMLLERYDDYVRHARLMTSIHATRYPLDLATPFTSQPSTSKLGDDVIKGRSHSPCSSRALSPETSMTFPTMPLQASASTNSNAVGGTLAEDASTQTNNSPTNAKKRTLSSTIGQPLVKALDGEIPHVAQSTHAGTSNKKRGLRRL